MTSLRNRLVGCLEPIDQDRRTTVDFSMRRTVVTSQVAMAAYIVTVILALGAIAAMVWISTLQVSIPAVQDAAVAGSTPETTETPAEMHGGSGQGINSQTQAGPLIASVVGLVVNPGMVEVPMGVRVVGTIDRAGGPLPEANLASVNPAVPLVDGQQIVVGTEALPAEMAEGGADVPGGFGADVAGIVGPGGSDGEININIVSATQLEELPGIGPVTTTRIIDSHEENRAFAGIDALEEAPGISPAKIEALRNATTV